MDTSYFLLLTFYFICFAFITWRYFHLGLALLFFLLPAYLIRFPLGMIPATMLEVMLIIIFVIFLIRGKGDKKIISHFSRPTSPASELAGGRAFLISKHHSLFLAAALFLLAATIAVFTAVDIRAAAGEWKAFYIEPFLLFLVLVIALSNEQLTKDKTNYVILPLILSGLTTAILAIYQHYTGWLVPAAFWENGNSFRVTAWYGFPNAVGLYLAPIVPLAIYLLKQNFALKKRNGKWEMGNGLTALSLFSFLISAPLAMIFAKSSGALIGLGSGLMLLLFLWPKTRWWTALIGLIGLIGLISPINPARQELLLQDRSGQIRVQMWGEAIELLRARPVLGAGLASYQERVKPYHTTVNNEGIEIFHHPHNIFLTMYVNLGLLGLVGFLGIIVWFYKVGFQSLKPKTYSLTPVPAPHFSISSFPHFLLSSMTIILVHGLVDSPYIKNDLAILFWVLIALMLSNAPDSLPKYSA